MKVWHIINRKRMERIWIFLIWLVLPGALFAQQDGYNQKGDEAMRRNDFRDAKMWYEEGVAQCDAYSIERLTAIWRENPEMRPSMRSLMNKCLNCLNVRATDNDTTAVKQLIVYYTEGIGTPVSKDLSRYWTSKLSNLRKPVVSYDEYVHRLEDQKVKERMKFFIGYTYSVKMPYGINVGGVKGPFGWYVRFKTNMAFPTSDVTCTDERGGELVGVPEGTVYSFTGRKKSGGYAGTVGVLVKCVPWMYASMGLGYGSRSVFYEYESRNFHTGEVEPAAWAKHTGASLSGVAVDADLMFRFGSLYASAGCSTVSFDYVDLNLGVGVFF